jgi:hypothetical protein
MTALAIRYNVHSVNPAKVKAPVTHNGVQVIADVPTLVVELLSSDGVMGHSYTFVGADADAAAKLFSVGETVTVTFGKDAKS